MRKNLKEIIKKLRNKRIVQTAVLTVFAALLTTAAITGQQKIEAGLTNTGAPGSVTVSSIKNFGGGNFQSDYQGAYFYILPSAEYSLGNDMYYALGGTLIKTGRTKTETYRDVWADDDFNYLETSWINQYSMTRWTGLTSVPAQTSEALMFVPYETYAGTTLKSGWKANISAICYYNYFASSPEEAYKVTTDKKYMNNRVFARPWNPLEFGDYCKTGIFYPTLAKWTADKDRSLSEDDLSINNSLKKKLSSKSAIKKFVSEHEGLQSDALKLWENILSLEGDNKVLTFDAAEKISTFLADGYNNYYQIRNGKYSSSKPYGVGLSDGLDGKYKLERWKPELTGSKYQYLTGSEVFTKNKFAQREYNLHMLDLMLCAYAAAVKQGASSEVKNVWLTAINNYINQDYGKGDTISNAFPIAICGGTIARGANQDKKGKTVNQCVYVGTQDLVNFAEQLENASNDDIHTGELKVNSRSITKSLIAPRQGGSGDASAYLIATPMHMHEMSNGKSFYSMEQKKYNEEAFKFGKQATAKKDSRFGPDKIDKNHQYKLLKQLPDYYTSYYKRMKSAMSGGEVGKVKNLESTSAKEIQSWHSNVVLRAVINTMYTRDKSGDIKEVKAKSDFRESIKLVRQQVPSGASNVIYQYKDAWGAMFIPSYLWPQPEPDPQANFGVVLSIRSTLYAQAENENETSEYTDAVFREPFVMKSTEYNTCPDWTNNHYKLNDRKDFIADTRELTANNTDKEPFQNNKETVQLQAQVVYPSKKDKTNFQTWYKSLDKDKLKVTMTVKPLYSGKITTAKSKKTKCEDTWNTSYTGSTAKSIGVTLENGKGTRLKLLNDKGCKVSKEDFESIFLPDSGLQGVKLALDPDNKFFEDTGFEVPTTTKGKKQYKVIGYQIHIKASGVKASDGKISREAETDSNKAGLRYSRKLEKIPEPDEASPSYNYTSIPEDFSELKEGSVYNEQFEAMAGVPSTRSLYFSTGGSEFIVNMRCNYEANQRAERTYHSHFNGTECEYKKTDQLKSLGAGGSLTETFVGDSNDNTISKSVNARGELHRSNKCDGQEATL